MSLWQKIKSKINPDKDLVILKKIRRQVGHATEANLSFFFDFDNRENAEAMAYALEKIGFSTEFFQNHDQTFTCQAKKNMPLEEERIKAMTCRFTELSIRMRGNFVSWGKTE